MFGGSDFVVDTGVDSIVLISLSESESLRFSLTLVLDILFCLMIVSQFFNI